MRLRLSRIADGGNDLTAELQHHQEQQHENSLAAAMQSQHFTVLISRQITVFNMHCVHVQLFDWAADYDC